MNIILAWEPKDKSVALVESEATAVVASGFSPDYIWMAVGDSDNLSAETLQCLAGREVILFPNSADRNDWAIRMGQIQPQVNCHLAISDQLETIVSGVKLIEHTK